MTNKITSEMEELERVKLYHAQMMRLHDLKIKKIRLDNNLIEVVEEIDKVDALIKSMQEG